MGQFGIGQAVTRFEDRRLLQGGGRYLDDMNLPGQAHAVLVRSVHAHARLRGVDTCWPSSPARTWPTSAPCR
jgi:carbon-monoxide dehydrogenase large subunit